MTVLGAQSAGRREDGIAAVRVVGAAIVVDGLLLTARRRSGPFAGLWEFPGGKVEPGESPEQALAREVAEELGVDVRVGQRVPGPAAGWWPLAAGLVMQVHRCDLVGGVPRPGADHDALEWIDPAADAGRPWIPADRPIVAEVARSMDAPAGARRPARPAPERPAELPSATP